MLNDGVGHSVTSIRIEVLGIPAPKGSYRAIMTRGARARAVLIPSGSDSRKRNLASWDQAVRIAAAEAAGPVSEPVFVDVALRVTMVFRMPRPRSHWGKRGLASSATIFPQVKPDVDKLARATADSLTGIIYDDDSRIVEKRLLKVYADPGREGATIVIEPREPMSQTELALW